MSVIAPSTKEQIVLAAERLFAERGIDGVSLRQIGTAAGNGNNSAVQYHFGSKERLLLAVFEYRLPWLNERGAFLIAAGAERARRQHYMSFVAMVYQYGRRDVFEQLPDIFLAPIRTYHHRLAVFLDHIPEPLRTHRIAQANVLITHAAADRERARSAGQVLLPFAVALGDLVDGTVGFLEAPVSAASRQALERAEAAQVTWPRFP